MKKVLSSIILVGTVALTAMAVDAQVSIYKEDPATLTEYQQMNQWLFNYMLDGTTSQNNDPKYAVMKDQWYDFGNKIKNKIIESFTIDPAITAACQKLESDFRAKMDAEAQALGFKDYNQLYGDVKYERVTKTPAIQAYMDEYSTTWSQVYASQQALTKSYNDELQKRFEAAFIDAVKKLQENSASMK